MDLTALFWYLVLLAGVVISLGVLFFLSAPDGRWRRTVEARLYKGLPWGTLIAVAGVAAFYLFVQDGLANPTNPVDIPFRAYSYFYPLGMLTSGFAHSGLGHVTSNLIATLVFGSLAEYAWGHFPEIESPSPDSSLLSTPFARIAAWVGAIVVIGISTSMFGLGPVIGFSGVVFAFVGFALVQYPIATIVAALSTRIVNGLYNAVRSPEIQQTATETFSAPWWSNVAIQGHALGLLLGALAGIALLYYRDVRPKPEHVWIAALAFAVDRGMWAIYLPVGDETYRLFRALGMAAVFLLAALLASGATATNRMLLSRIELSRREAAVGLVIAAFVAMSAVAIPLNLYVVDDATVGLETAEPIEVEDYTVFYAEGVQNQFIPAIPIPGDVETEERVNASGVIVVSERRNIWWQEVSRNRLASSGSATVRVGGLAWNEDLLATRTTWSVAGSDPTYHVRLGPADTEERAVVFRAPPARSDAVIDGRNTTIAPVDDYFEITVSRDDDLLGSARIPQDTESVAIGGLTFVREDQSLFAERGETRVRVAQKGREG